MRTHVHGLRSIGPVTAVVLLAMSGTPARADGGGLDTGFGAGGTVTIEANGYAPSAAVASDGGIFVCGARSVPGADPTGRARSTWLIRRFESDGTLDTGFGTGGEVALFGASSDVARRVAVDAVGRVLVVGTASTVTTSKRSSIVTATIRVVRLTATGALDTSFGSGGVIQVVPPGALSVGQGPAGSLLVQTDGNIVVAGAAPFAIDKKGTTRALPYLARYLDSGALDTTFGDVGFSVESRVAGGAISVARQSTGHFALALRGEVGWIVTRHLADGGVDSSFAPAQLSGSFIGGIAVDAMDRIVATGRNTYPDGNFDVQVARYEAAGGLDTSFGTAGISLIHVTDRQNTWVDPLPDATDGTILVAVNLATAGAFAPIRLLEDGGLDTTYGSEGVGAEVAGNVTGLARTPDGSTLLTGQVVTSGWQWVLAQYVPE
jgi:uncharacterized delta-60 repeat protein